MVKVYRSTVLEAPANRVWRDLRDFNGLPNWHPLIELSRIEKSHPADKVGCVRNFQLKDGARIREKLLSNSADHSMKQRLPSVTGNSLTVAT